jgi:hypothetical protein
LTSQIDLSVLSEMMSPTAAGRMLVETPSRVLAARLLLAHWDAGAVRLPIEARHQLDDRRLERILDMSGIIFVMILVSLISPTSRVSASFTSPARFLRQ